MAENPAKEERDSGGPGFFARWRAQLPGVAASLTTAFLLWGASIMVEPARRYLYGKPDFGYPIFCTADAVPGPNGGLRVEFYAVNRSADEFTGAGLQQQLDQTLEASGRGSAKILLKADDNLVIGRLISDADFNGDKGQLHLAPVAGGVEVTIERIKGRSILRGLIDLPDEPAGGTRSARGVYVPFTISDLYDTCYTAK